MIKEPGIFNRSRISPAATGCGPIFELRRNLNITQHELAQDIGFSLRGVAKLERQGRVPLNAQVRAQLIQLANCIPSTEHRNAIVKELQTRSR